MSRATFNIIESAETLLNLLSQEKDGYKHKRIKALYLLKSQKAETFRGVAKLLDVPAQRVGEWLKEYHKNGLKGLLSMQNKCLFKETFISETIDTLSQLISQENNPQKCKRLQALYLLQTNNLAPPDIANSLGISLATLQSWVGRYRQKGLEGLLIFQEKHRVKDINIVESSEFLLDWISQEKDEQRRNKLEVLYFLKTQKTKTPKEIAQILNVSSSTILGWILKYRQGGLKALLPERKFPKIVDINITESSETLLELLEQEKNKWTYKKLQALYLIKTQQVKTSQDIAERIDVHPQVPDAWIKQYYSHGLVGLLPKNHSIRLSSIPNWAVERLLEELQEVQFLPNATTVKIWMETVLGTQVTRDIASEILASKIKPRWEPNSKQELIQNPTQLSIEPEIYRDYTQWKEEKGFSSDGQALKQLMHEFFDISSSPLPTANFQEMAALEQITLAPLPEIPDYLNQSQLSQRLEVSNAVLSKNRNKPNFSKWTKLKDPDGVGWQWVPNIRQYKSLIKQDDFY